MTLGEGRGDVGEWVAGVSSGLVVEMVRTAIVSKVMVETDVVSRF